jgi:hypothetical protein
LKGKRDTREYEEWFLRYIPLEHAKTVKGTAKGTAKTRKRKNTTD